MSRSVRQDYPPKGATMPRYSEALQDVLNHVTPPLPTVTPPLPTVTPPLPSGTAVIPGVTTNNTTNVTSGALVYRTLKERVETPTEQELAEWRATCPIPEALGNPKMTANRAYYTAVANLPGLQGVDVEIIIHNAGKPLPVVRFTNVPLTIVDEAVAHINDNADGVG